jgi:oxygen-independent coproporphyrinogen-3 oxidase
MVELLKLYVKSKAKPSKNTELTGYIFPSENIGLYLHVPFCKHFCDFCPYHKLKYDPARLCQESAVKISLYPKTG